MHSTRQKPKQPRLQPDPPTPSLGFPGANYVKSTTATGYVVGGGWEYKFSPAWSAKFEYQYMNLGRNDPVDSFFGSYAFNGGTVHDDAFQTLRVGVNYFFTPEYAPMK